MGMLPLVVGLLRSGLASEEILVLLCKFSALGVFDRNPFAAARI